MRLGREPFTALGTAASQNSETANGRHAFAEAVAALANKAAWLIRAFHGNFSV